MTVYAIQRLQGILPWNPAGMPAVPPDLAFNTAVSFTTNTNWQSYGGETTLSYLTQMLALTVQNGLDRGRKVIAARPGDKIDLAPHGLPCDVIFVDGRPLGIV